MTNPWMKFYPRDWRGDQALRAVSIAARGFWMECLCIMHEAKPYGHLVLNGNPVDGGTLARMTGTTVDEVSALMAELRQAGVLSVTSRGVVFSRRMTKDHARAQKGRKAVNSRWSQASDDVEQSEAPNRSPSRSPITQKPEARSQIPERKIDIGIAETGNPPAREQPSDDYGGRTEPSAPIPEQRRSTNGHGASAQQSLIPLDQAQPPPKRSRKVKTALPPDWRLLDDGWSYAAGKGLTGDRIEQEAEKFRDYHLSRGNVMADWAAAWRTWVGNAGKFSGPASSGYRQHDPPSRADSAIQGIQNFLIRNGELS